MAASPTGGVPSECWRDVRALLHVRVPNPAPLGYDQDQFSTQNWVKTTQRPNPAVSTQHLGWKNNPAFFRVYRHRYFTCGIDSSYRYWSISMNRYTPTLYQQKPLMWHCWQILQKWMISTVNLSGSRKSSRYFSPTVLWVLWIGHYSFHMFFFY